MMLPSKLKPQPKLSTSFLYCTLPTFHTESFTSFAAYLYSKDERALPWNLHSSKCFVFPHNNNNNNNNNTCILIYVAIAADTDVTQKEAESN
jgi:hypothetical protein